MLTDDSFSEAAQLTEEMAASSTACSLCAKEACAVAAATCASTTSVSPTHLRCAARDDSTLAPATAEPTDARDPASPSADMFAVTLLVPTMFTTAHGRPICVRDARYVRRDSAEWHLWHHTRSQAAHPAHTGPFRHPMQASNDPGAADSLEEHDYLPHFQPPWRQLPPQTSPCLMRSDAGPVSGDEAAMSAGRRRGRSCPSECDLTNEGDADVFGDEPVTLSLRTRYSGFTRADGSMILLH